MDSPLVIIAELLYGIISGVLQTIFFIFEKLGELVLSLMFFSTLGIFGFILAVVIGAAVFILMTKFIFKSSRTLLAIGIALLIVGAILALLWLI